MHPDSSKTRTGNATLGSYRPVLHFPSFSMLCRTRNATSLWIRARGNGFSSGNWIDPRPVVNFERSFAKAFIAAAVGKKPMWCLNPPNITNILR